MFKQIKDIELYFQQNQKLGIKLGLERMRTLLHYLDNPEQNFRAIHVAGTNGKGSTINFINRALVANGYRIGLFTSPSFSKLNGHIFINEQPISDDDFLTIFKQMYPIIEVMKRQGMHPTNFEILTALAFVYFTKGLDLALVETGMGGKEDTTNCLTPIVSMITNVTKDHTHFLGNTLEEIASHKAGIIKDDIPVVIGKMDDQAFAVIKEEAKMKDAPLYKLCHDFTYSHVEATHPQQSFVWKNRALDEYPVSLTMAGVHQVYNAAMAIQTLKLLEKGRFIIDWEKALTAIEQTQVPGRFERVSEKPLIILDGAHNSAGIDAFLQTVSQTATGKKKHLIFAGFQDKELTIMIHKCIGHFDTIIWTSFAHRRAPTCEEIVKAVDTGDIQIIDDWKKAIDYIMNGSLEDSYYITGSLHFISIVRNYIKEGKSLI
ncbi:MAG TPA: folylpolyglutamate synthase/dihydrofolate synthase family protein [Bacillota bacterium]